MQLEDEKYTTLHAPTLTRGVIIGVLVIAVVLLLGGLYIWGSLLSKQASEQATFLPPVNTEPETPRADADIQILKTVSNSDEMPAIEADLSSTNIDELDKETPLVENDLKQQP